MMLGKVLGFFFSFSFPNLHISVIVAVYYG